MEPLVFLVGLVVAVLATWGGEAVWAAVKGTAAFLVGLVALGLVVGVGLTLVMLVWRVALWAWGGQ